jgi:lysyl-tRNA synthetase class 1
MLKEHLQKPLTSVPDPFGTHTSYGAHMNARLCAFLDRFGFEYEFKSATELYKMGVYDEKLLLLLERYDEVMQVMLPTLGEERQKTYSPFLPIDPKTGTVLYVPVVERNVKKGTIVYQNEDGTKEEIPVTGGRCKLQWKPDMGMRWAALGVDYEMYGKDHLTSGQLYSAICKILGAKPPEQFVYEMFLDEKGEKISKSKGNGITIEEWLKYAPEESLALYMYLKPRTAKRLYFDVIPQQVDDYLAHIEKFPAEPDEAKKIENPVWHIHSGNPPKPEQAIRFGLLLNLASVAGAHDKKVLWGFISRHFPNVTPANSPMLDRLAGYAVAYYNDFVKPEKRYRAPSEMEKKALEELAAALEAAPEGATAEDLQNIVYEIGKHYPFANLRDWFGALYETLLGQKQGPRMGSFIALYGKEETLALIRKVLKGESLAA